MRKPSKDQQIATLQKSVDAMHETALTAMRERDDAQALLAKGGTADTAQLIRLSRLWCPDCNPDEVTWDGLADAIRVNFQAEKENHAFLSARAEAHDLAIQSRPGQPRSFRDLLEDVCGLLVRQAEEIAELETDRDTANRATEDAKQGAIDLLAGLGLDTYPLRGYEDLGDSNLILTMRSRGIPQ